MLFGKCPYKKTLFDQEKMWQLNLGKDRTLSPPEDADQAKKRWHLY